MPPGTKHYHFLFPQLICYLFCFRFKRQIIAKMCTLKDRSGCHANRSCTFKHYIIRRKVFFLKKYFKKLFFLYIEAGRQTDRQTDYISASSIFIGENKKKNITHINKNTVILTITLVLSGERQGFWERKSTLIQWAERQRFLFHALHLNRPHECHVNAQGISFTLHEKDS